MQMKTACQQCADLTRQLQDAAQEELQLYNNYFVDILFRSMQPRQQVCRGSSPASSMLSGNVQLLCSEATTKPLQKTGYTGGCD